MTGLVLERQSLGAWDPRAVRDDDGDAAEARAERRATAFLAKRQALLDLLGQAWFRPTLLVGLEGRPTLGPLLDGDGRALRWYLWSPKQRALLDRFARMPAPAELNARAAFAREHGLRYGLVPPGWRLTVDSLREWLEA